MANIVPHFDLPFTLTPKGANVADQNSHQDIANAIVAIAYTELGFRVDTPEFGLPDLTFRNQPLLTEDVLGIIRNQEPRIDLIADERPDILNPLIDRITLTINEVSLNGGVS